MKKLSRSFFGKAMESCRFWIFLFWGGFDSKSSRTLFSIKKYFSKKDFAFIVDLAVVTASLIKTFDTFQFYEYCLISTFPQYWSAIISKKSLDTPNFCWISIALTTIHLSLTVIIWEKKYFPLLGTVLNKKTSENDFSKSLILHKEKISGINVQWCLEITWKTLTFAS